MANANWSNPQLTSTYTNFVSEVKNRDEDLALQFDGTTSTNLPTNTIRWDSTANRWKKWNGTSWAELASIYALTGLSTTGAATIGTTLGVTGAITGSSTVTGTALIPSGSSVPVNGLYLPSANSVAIATNSAQRLAIDSSGNISIPGALSTTGTNTAASFIPTSSTVPTNGLYLSAANSVAISTNGSGRLFVDSSGRVGVGTSSPSSLIHAKGSSGADVTFRLEPFSNTTKSTLYLSSVGAGDGGLQYDSANNNCKLFSYNDLTFNVGTSNVSGVIGNERVRITQAGLVGIGTSTPGALLSVDSGSTGLLASFNSTNANGGYITGYSSGVAIWDLGSAKQTTNVGTSADVGFSSRTGYLALGTANTERLRITAGGLVGIGTTTVNEKLEISGGNIRITSSSAGVNNAGGTLNVFESGGTRCGYVGFSSGGAIIYNESGNTNPIRFFQNGSEAMRVDGSSRLLVGTSTSPSSGDGQYAKLVVQANTGNAGNGAYVSLQRGEAATTITAGEELGLITYADSAGNSFGTVACQADGTAGSGDYPGRLVFSTTADGAASPTERFRISSDGSISSVIPGGSTLYPRFGCRAWVNFNGTGTVAIRASGNVSSITDNGTGFYTVNFTTAMPDANYSITAMADGTNNGTVCSIGHGDSDNTGLAAGSARVESRGGQGSGAAFDATYYCVAIFR